MHTQVQALFDFAKHKYHLTMHGGASGMNNSVSWVYLAEDVQNISFLKGGEFIITTGLFTLEKTTLFEFVHKISMKNCSGILINVGKYLHESDITPEILEFCLYNKLPIFSMPWEVHLIEIMQDYCTLLLHDNQTSDALSAAFQSTLYQNPVPENVLRTLSQYGFYLNCNYKVLVIRHLKDITRITSPFNRYNLHYHLFFYDNLYIMILPINDSSIPLSTIVDIICYYDSILLGISNTITSLSDISLAYKRARFSLAVADFWKQPAIYFDELGIFELLFSTQDPTLLPALYKKYLAPLVSYDTKHDSSYLETLRIYLLSDCNLLETSSRMFAHRNTIVYRLKKIKELLQTDLDNSMIKFNLLMAFYIKEFLEITS